MNFVFYSSAIVAVLATLLVITRANAVHALLYLIASLLAMALLFFALGAPFAAALQIIIYAGAIMVLFIFVIMMLNLGSATARQEAQWLKPGIWLGPSLLCGILALELAYFLMHDSAQVLSGAPIPPKQVGIALFGPYALGVELASMLLLAGLVGAYHLGRRSGR
ncbi:MAG: NADH-quinone oxidoreductase subunit J [Nitrospirae bacterium]|nr:NADH-quinone oxidoreductase subunit J [Nitrospirota bacterium]NTW67676.1 NADH-quinone oxidoreductase subunit J [Nitrospirota bacterium]